MSKAAFTPGGIMTALVTPFHPDGSIDWAAQEKIIEFQIKSQVSGLVVTAGSGEYITLQPDERPQVVRHAVEAARGRVPVLAGILAHDTGSAIIATHAAEKAGAQGLLLLTPFYINPSPAGIVKHFKRVAAETDLPILLYNIPGRTGINMDTVTLEQLADLPQVVGMKECDRDMARVADKMRVLGSRVPVLCGDDDLLLPFLVLGSPGAIMAGSNIVAPLAVQIYRAAKESRWEDARKLYIEKMIPFVNLFLRRDHPGPLKQMMGLAGLPVGCGRPPLEPVSEETLAGIGTEMRKLGLIK